MKYDQKLTNFLETYKFQWINCIDNTGKKHGGRLMHWDENGAILGADTRMYDPIIELHGVGATVSEILATNEIKSLSIQKLGSDNVITDITIF